MSVDALLFIALSLGLMHALDADHVMAISALSNEKPGVRRTLNFSAHWALGHGGVLLLSGALLFGLGVAIPESFQQFAESSVGVLLVALGLACFWQLHKETCLATRGVIHSDMTSVMNRSVETRTYRPWLNHGHKGDTDRFLAKPVLVGVLHGVAGSAPALAIIPALAEGQLSFAMSYLLLFSVGVMVSMMCFGLGLAYFQGFLAQRHAFLYYWSRRAVAMSAILLGGFWLSRVV